MMSDIIMELKNAVEGLNKYGMAEDYFV